MSKKSDLKKKIEESERELADLEQKRLRSQSALLQCYIEHTTPTDIDVEYFRVYSQLIDLERDNLKKLNDELKALGG